MLRSKLLCDSRSMLLLFTSIVIQFVSGIADDSSNKKNETKSQSPTKSHTNTASKVIIILLGIVAVGLFSFFLFKLWQKKKREEQHARLLKLFEDDDELEVELGLRD